MFDKAKPRVTSKPPSVDQRGFERRPTLAPSVGGFLESTVSSEHLAQAESARNPFDFSDTDGGFGTRRDSRYRQAFASEGHSRFAQRARRFCQEESTVAGNFNHSEDREAGTFVRFVHELLL